MLFQIERAHAMPSTVAENGISLEGFRSLGTGKILQTSRKKKIGQKHWKLEGSGIISSFLKENDFSPEF